MNAENDLIAMVRQLVEAENEAGERGSEKANSILSINFTTITRASGKEEGRASLLRAVAQPTNPDIHRELDEGEFWVQESEGLGVVRSVITTKPRARPEEISGRFRNLHVFERAEEGWRCVVWQVTKLG
jgi:hypothetical protein